MMDHARHLSSPSPTSPFLFHHSERSFTKSNPLTPLLSSTADVTNVDDCFATNPPSLITHNHHHLQNHLNNHLHNPSHYPFDNNNNDHTTLVVNHNHSHNRDHQNHHVDQDSLTGADDDDDDGMHNMLSGSSTSSTSTMPLLTESHSFSRISLEEYSPLSLVEDCDNALPISPTSLACASLNNHHHLHHNHFKTCLNSLKMDNLGDDNDSVGNVGGVTDVVNTDDARSLSPSLLSSSANNNHHNLWSNSSSTAISQNTSILNSSSASFLLSHHHHHSHPHHQLNSLIQQLEPQSLDEPPAPLTTTNINHNYGANSILTNSVSLAQHQSVDNRPSSEPPQGTGSDLPDDDSKSLICQPVQSKFGNTTTNLKSTSIKLAPVTASNSSNISNSNDSSNSYNKSRKSRSNRSGKSNSVSKQANTSIGNKLQQEQKAGDLVEKIKFSSGNKKNSLDQLQQPQPVHSSKLHLQLNHHKKLQELQQRLFGPTPVSSQNTNEPIEVNATQPEAGVETNNRDNVDSTNSVTTTVVKPELDSSVQDAKQQRDNKNTTSSTSKVGANSGTNGNKATATTSAPPTRTRPVRTRKSRAKTTEHCSSTTSDNSLAITTNTSKTSSKVVKSETAEPDTTTKSSDHIKLADLLGSSASSVVVDAIKSSTSNEFILNGFATTTNNDNPSQTGETGDKRVQQIQLQLNPSLTVVANGGLMQSIGIQQNPIVQQQQQQASSNGAVLTTTTNQIICRPQVIQASNGQLKGIMSNNNELLKNGETVQLTNWSLQSANNSNGNNNNVNNNQQTTIGAHQIAIQVICQDGTSLVLPVSSAAGLNAAVSLSSQQQQIQAVLANNAVNPQQQQQQRNNNTNQQILPLVSVSNIVAQQQLNPSQSITATASPSSSNQQSQLCTVTNQQQTSTTRPTSGLAASSPTLAALLDANSSRNNNNGFLDLNNNGNNPSGQNFVSTNLLRKLVTGSTQAPDQKQTTAATLCLPLNSGTQVTISPTSTLAQTANTTSTNGTSNNSAKNQVATKNAGGSSNKHGSSEKRIKLEKVETTNDNTSNNTSTSIESQGLVVVANGNEKVVSKQAAPVSSSGQQLNTSQQQQTGSTTSTTNTSISSTKGSNSSVMSTNLAYKLTRIGTSTGNRQVDPTQPFRCEHCNSTFTRLGNFTRHKKIHTVPTKDGQRFKCDVCSKSFLQRCDLARHLHIHRGTEPHRCNICGKGYIRHSDLVTHQRFHNKEKPFGCPHCSKGFCQRGDLNRHLRSIHLQMKPILCPCCNRKFAKQETLLRHLNTAHRSKPGTNTPGSAIITELPPNYTITTTQQGDDKQTTISVVTNATTATALLNNL